MNTINTKFKGKQIVIVEDDVSSGRYYEVLLTNAGAEVKIFHTGKEFVDYLAGNKIIDLVIMDFLVPFVNGIECTRIFRKERKNTPVIMITAYSSEPAKTEAYLAGCNEYLLKPVYPEKMFFLLGKYLMPNISIPVSY